jgi:small subunit ribosomal protein S18
MSEGIISNSVLFNKKQSNRRGNRCPLSAKDAPVIDYKNIQLLRSYISEKGKILPSRITSVSTIKQRELKLAIKRARNLALLPFTTI